MLSQMTPRQFREWLAKDKIEPIGTEKIAWVIAEFAAMVGNRMGLNSEPSDFVSWSKASKRKKQGKPQSMMSPNEAASVFAAAYGGVPSRS